MAELDADYSSAGFGGELDWGRTPALIVVDLCHAYTDPASPLFVEVAPAVVAATQVLLGAARDARVPVIFTRVEFAPGGADGGLFFRKVPALANFVRGNPLAEFLDEAGPVDGDVVVTKQYASAFFGTSLASTLVALGVDTALVCGMSTSGCVRATALDALQHGFVPVVISDASGDRHEDPHRSNLFDLEQKYATVMTAAEAAARLAV